MIWFLSSLCVLISVVSLFLLNYTIYDTISILVSQAPALPKDWTDYTISHLRSSRRSSLVYTTRNLGISVHSEEGNGYVLQHGSNLELYWDYFKISKDLSSKDREFTNSGQSLMKLDNIHNVFLSRSNYQYKLN